jgi:hypothetical protein
MENIKIDKAVFYRLGETQTYACVFYKNGNPVGNFLDTLGVFIPDVKEWLETKYTGIKIEMV